MDTVMQPRKASSALAVSRFLLGVGSLFAMYHVSVCFLFLGVCLALVDSSTEGCSGRSSSPVPSLSSSGAT